MNDDKNLAEMMSPLQALGLYWHLDNGNVQPDYAVGFRHNDKAYRKRPGYLFVGRAIEAAVATIEGNVTPGHEIAFIPLCQNGWRKQSRWAGLKFRCVNGADEVIRKRAERAFTCLRAHARERSTLLEHCGDGSWQLWAIGEGFSSHATLSKLLRRVTDDAGITIDGDLCQSFPSDIRLGMPAPGSWDPHSQTVSQIVSANLAPFLARPLHSRP